MVDGDILDVILAWKDANNHLFVRYEASETTYCKLTLGECKAGVNTLFDDHTPLKVACTAKTVGHQDPSIDEGEWREIEIGFDRAVFLASSYNESADLWDLWKHQAVPSEPARKVGLRRPSGNTGPIYFRSFFASEHLRTDATCPDLGCHCGWPALPETLTGTIELVSGGPCGQVPDPHEITLRRVMPREVNYPRRWYSDPDLTCTNINPDFEGGLFYPIFQLQCRAAVRFGADKFRLISYNHDTQGDTIPPDDCKNELEILPGPVDWNLVSESCDPFEMIYESDPGSVLYPCCTTVNFEDHRDEVFRLTITE